MSDMTHGHGMMFTLILLALIDSRKEGIVGSQDSPFGRLPDGGAQVFAAPFGHLARTDFLATIGQPDVKAGGGYQLAGTLPRRIFGRGKVGQQLTGCRAEPTGEMVAIFGKDPIQQTHQTLFLGDGRLRALIAQAGQIAQLSPFGGGPGRDPGLFGVP